MTRHLEKTRRSWWWLGGLACVLVVGAGFAAMVGARAGDTDALADQPTAVAARGPLTISVTESGTIQARDQVVIKSEVEGQTRIIFLVPEGTMVERDQLLVELDASTYQDQLVDQQIRVQNAEAAFIRSRENLEVVRSQGVSDVAQAELAHRFAQEDLKQYEEGEYPKQLKELESKITLAREELERAAEKLKWSETLFKEQYISQTELEADRLTRNRAELEHELAVASRDLLKNFTYHRRVDELTSNISQTQMEFERVQRRARADLIQAEADLKAKEAEYNQQQSRLEKINQQIQKTKIYAPIRGMVIYATSAQGNWRGNAEPLAEGQTVRERQELIYLPTADSMNAEIKIHESSLQKIRLGLPVRVTVDALPGREFSGRVSRIAPLPDAQSMWLNPDLKVYTTQIQLDGAGEGLRSGMSCRAEILVERYPDAVYVPLQAVLRVKGQPTAWVVRGHRTEARAVTLGLDNNRMVKIEAGLEPGERVLLAPPLAAASEAARPSEGPEAQAETDSAAATDNAAMPAPNASNAEPSAALSPSAPPREMTAEQREEMRRRLENLSPEERQKLREQRQRQRSPVAQESGS